MACIEHEFKHVFDARVGYVYFTYLNSFASEALKYMYETVEFLILYENYMVILLALYLRILELNSLVKCGRLLPRDTDIKG